MPLLDRCRKFRESVDLVIGGNLLLALQERNFRRLLSLIRQGNCEGLGTDVHIEDREIRLGYHVGVWFYLSRPPPLRRSRWLPRSRYDPRAGARIGGEHHPGLIGVDHALDNNCQRRLFGYPLETAVAQCSIRSEGRPALPNRVYQILVS